MIIEMIVQILVVMANAVFGWFPTVETLPTILGIDLDYQLELYIGMIYRLSESLWIIADLIVILKLVLAYYLAKLVLRFFFGARFA